MWLKAQNEMAGLLPHAAMGPVERMVRRLFMGGTCGSSDVSRENSQK